jgi:hypothetical protein
VRFRRWRVPWRGFVGNGRHRGRSRPALGQFLHDQLKLELSPAKTLITRAPAKSLAVHDRP